MISIRKSMPGQQTKLVHLIPIILFGLIATVSHAQEGDCWGNSRGDEKLTGVSHASIPDQPALLWNFNTGEGIKASPVVCKGVIVVGTVSGQLYGINTDGTLKWKIVTDNSIEAPALIVDGMVYAGNLDGTLYAIDLESGNIRWTYTCENQIMGAPSYFRSADKKVVMVGSYDYYLHGVDPSSGKGLWKYETLNYINGTSAIYKGAAVFGGCDGFIRGIDALDGKERFGMEISTYVASSACIDGDLAFVGDYDGRFSAVDLLNQRVTWVFENREANLPFIASPAVSGQHVFIGNRDKYMYCLNKSDGELVWK